MLKTICNLCEQEIKPRTTASAFIFIEIGLTKDMRETATQIQEDYCETCTDKVKREIKKLKNESNKREIK